MAAQQTLIAETIRGMKVALRRRDDDSDSDTSIQQHTNRGNKLKRHAAHVREGRLDTTGGRSYRKKIVHAGYQRYIIHKNPTRYDEDGDVVEDDGEDEDGQASPDEENPFGETKLEYLLAPLTSPGELANHPSLAYPYTSKHLTEMAENARDMLHRERETLWRIKQLLHRFRGDEMWAPLEKVETIHDEALLDGDGIESYNEVDLSMNDSMTSNDHGANGMMDVDSKPAGMEQDLAGIGARLDPANGVHSIDMAMQDKQAVKPNEGPEMHHEATNGIHLTATNKEADEDHAMNDAVEHDQANGREISSLVPPHGNGETNGDDIEPGSIRKSIEPESSSASVSGQPQHRMTTRAKARTPPTPDPNASQSASPVSSSIPSLSSFYLAPPSALPDRDFGLPAPEAEETRRILLLYVQKQEEIVRNAESMLMGLLKADRARKEVWGWCKADRHVGTMSDGEDWYDKEEWGLKDDLVKGKEEEDVEEEGGRKGRRRREGKGKAA